MRFVWNSTVNISNECYHNDITVMSFTNIKCSGVALESIP